MRLLEVDAWTISFWRSAFMALTLALFVLATNGRDTAGEFRRIGRPGLILAASYSVTFILFILALSHTTVANTVVIMSATPLFAAVAAWLLLREPISRGLLVSVVAAAFGIALMMADSLGSGNILGDLLAFGVALTQAANTVIMRRSRAVNLLPALCLAGAFSAVIALPFATPLAPSPREFLILGTLGGIQLGLGLGLFSLGLRYVSAAQASLLALLETVLSPLWAWLGVGERPSGQALLGGGIVLGALTAQAWRGAKRQPEPTRKLVT